jgi:DNA repair exonuclease SbcCD ATPase subunit
VPPICVLNCSPKVETLQTELATANHEKEMFELELNTLKEMKTANDAAAASSSSAPTAGSADLANELQSAKLTNEKLTNALRQLKQAFVEEKQKREQAEVVAANYDKSVEELTALRADSNHFLSLLFSSSLFVVRCFFLNKNNCFFLVALCSCRTESSARCTR